MDIKTEILDLCHKARDGARALAQLTTEQKNAVLLAMADALERNASVIKAANAKDMEASKAAGLSAAILDRLALDDKRITDMAKGLREVAALPDPVGQVISETTRPNGLRIRKVRVPIGVIAIIYESRPNVTADSAALCFKSGNATILRGGKEAIHSNLAIVNMMKDSCRGVPVCTPQHGSRERADTQVRPYLPENAIQLVSTTDREAVRILAQAEGLVDLLIPRGGEGLVRAVAEVARVPVIKHYKGVCHVFVDAAADPDKAEKIVVNAKCQRPATCNAMETLLVHEKIAPKILPRLAKALAEKKVELRCDAKARELVGAHPSVRPYVKPATEEDWYAEYLDLILAVRVVPNADAAIEHITKYGSAHSDAIVTEDKVTAEKFLRRVDSAAVFWNASTRFTDGGEFGMGAEIGISTDKIGARGPMGLEELTSYKYVVYGDGQVRQ